ncbi:hypothetical protein EJ04DRAFT_110003 [Polyplosphaeria fusca]|uniref:Uncharacterized protein n=1 Tax=Polyplosphaeria fusca TaxID=682080 RepID=A0A9P4QIZ1_9PLEO|nr:hypothetical protein EJ04DRAFT_110003 [Polyplosphaeria fusca]
MTMMSFEDSLLTAGLHSTGIEGEGQISNPAAISTGAVARYGIHFPRQTQVALWNAPRHAMPRNYFNDPEMMASTYQGRGPQREDSWKFSGTETAHCIKWPLQRAKLLVFFIPCRHPNSIYPRTHKISSDPQGTRRNGRPRQNG